MEHDPDLFLQLGAKHQRLRRATEAARVELAERIRAAARSGMTQVEIVRITGYTRDQVRQICLPEDRRRRRNRSGEHDLAAA